MPWYSIVIDPVYRAGNTLEPVFHYLKPVATAIYLIGTTAITGIAYAGYCLLGTEDTLNSVCKNITDNNLESMTSLCASDSLHNAILIIGVGAALISFYASRGREFIYKVNAATGLLPLDALDYVPPYSDPLHRSIRYLGYTLGGLSSVFSAMGYHGGVHFIYSKVTGDSSLTIWNESFFLIATLSSCSVVGTFNVMRTAQGLSWFFNQTVALLSSEKRKSAQEALAQLPPETKQTIERQLTQQKETIANIFSENTIHSKEFTDFQCASDALLTFFKKSQRKVPTENVPLLGGLTTEPFPPHPSLSPTLRAVERGNL